MAAEEAAQLELPPGTCASVLSRTQRALPKVDFGGRPDPVSTGGESEVGPEDWLERARFRGFSLGRPYRTNVHVWGDFAAPEDSLRVLVGPLSESGRVGRGGLETGPDRGLGLGQDSLVPVRRFANASGRRLGTPGVRSSPREGWAPPPWGGQGRIPADCVTDRVDGMSRREVRMVRLGLPNRPADCR
jgi:hypothetical protein